MDRFFKTRQAWPAAIMVLLATAVVLIYANVLRAPFVFDDVPNIRGNPHIRITALSFEKILGVVHSPSLRPFANLTFALNYYFHGYDVAGYHTVNIAIHILAGFLVFLVVRLTLGLIHHDKKELIAALASLLWIANPVHTQSVTYIVQRMTSLSALFFLSALYLYIKARLRQKIQKPLVPLFFALCGLSGILALLAKQIAVTLPFFILLYEWYFFQDLDPAWGKKQVRWLGIVTLLGLAIALVYLGKSPMDKILSMYDKQTFTMGQRLLTEPRVIFLYLSLIFFPHPSRLNLDYDFPVSTSLIDPVTTIISIAGIIGLAAAAFFTARKYRLVSFAIVWFLGNLAIESSFLGLALVFEHRVYLPSVFVVAALAWAVVTYVRPQPLAAGVLCAVAVLWGFWTYQRNAVWADDVALWQDTAKKSPGLARPWNNLGRALEDKGETDRAMALYSKAIDVDPGYVNAYCNLGGALLKQGKTGEAVPVLEKALQVNALFRETYNNLAIAWNRLGRPDKAADYCRTVLGRYPDYTEAKNTLGVILLGQGDAGAAAAWFAQVLQAEPGHTEALMNMALIARQQGDREKAILLLEKAVSQDPSLPDARYLLGEAYGMAGDNSRAALHLSEAVRLAPGSARTHNAFGNVLLNTGDIEGAMAHYLEAITADPDFVPALSNLAGLYARQGRIDQALVQLERIKALAPGNPEPLVKIGALYQQTGNFRRAETYYKTALDADPACTACLNRLGGLYAQTGRLAEATGAFEKLSLLAPDNPGVHYNLACLYARQNRTDPAVKSLQKALDTGYRDMDRIRTDKDLDSIRNTEFYKTRINGQK